MLQLNLTLRKISIFGFILCACLLLGAVFIEHIYMIPPCPLCMLQRYVFAILGCIFLIGAVCNFKSFLRYVYSTSIVLFSMLGFAIAARQFWLQYIAPPQQYSCSASLHRLIELHPMLDALKIALNGSAECSKIDFTVFTISIAGWSLYIFGVMVILGLYIIYLQKKRRIL